MHVIQKKKKTKKTKEDGSKFTDFHAAKEEYIVTPMQVKRQQAPTFAFCRSFALVCFHSYFRQFTTWKTVKSVIISLPLLSFCNLSLLQALRSGRH